MLNGIFRYSWINIYVFSLCCLDVEASEERQRAYIKEAAGISTADELSKLANLKEKGVITDAEFETHKKFFFI